MRDEVMTFTVGALREMKFDVDGVGADTVLGPLGVDLDSVAVVELTVRVEEAFGVRFREEDMEAMAAMTIGDFAAEVARRAPDPAGGRRP